MAKGKTVSGGATGTARKAPPFSGKVGRSAMAPASKGLGGPAGNARSTVREGAAPQLDAMRPARLSGSSLTKGPVAKQEEVRSFVTPAKSGKGIGGPTSGLYITSPHSTDGR